VRDLGLSVWNLTFGDSVIRDSGFGIRGLGFRVSRFGIWDSGCGTLASQRVEDNLRVVAPAVPRRARI